MRFVLPFVKTIPRHYRRRLRRRSCQLRRLCKAKDLLLFRKFGSKLFTFTVLHSTDKFSNEQNIFGLTFAAAEEAIVSATPGVIPEETVEGEKSTV